MDYKKKYKWVLAGFIIMLLLNILVLGSIWMVKNGGRPFGRDGAVQFRVQRFMERELDFSEAQKQAFEELRRDHIQETRSIYGDIRKQRRALFAELQGDEEDDSAVRIDSLTNLIGQSQARLDSAIYKHFKEIRSICNVEQRQKFDRIIEKVMVRMEPGRQHRRLKEN